MPRRYATEHTKLTHVVGLLGGIAWTNNVNVVQALAEGEGVSPLPFTTGLAFLNHLSQAYIVHDLAADAKIDILLLQQNDTPFSTFLSNYTTMTDRAGWTAEQKIDGLKTRVNREMREMHQSNVDDPTAGDWEAWAQRFMKYAQKIAENKALKKHHTQQPKQKSNNPHTRAPKPQNPTPQANSDAMDLDQMTIARLHPAYRQRRIDNDLCKRCGGEGHYAKNCDGAGNVVPDRFVAARGRGDGSSSRGRGNGRDSYGCSNYGRGNYPV